MPTRFHTSLFKLMQADMLLIMGTSLTVHPFASLAGLVLPRCPRVLINLEPAGDIGSRENDIVLLGKCDEVIQAICSQLGWQDELDQLWQSTSDSVDEDFREQTNSHPKSEPSKTTVRSCESEVQQLVEQLTKDIAHGMSINVDGAQNLHQEKNVVVEPTSAVDTYKQDRPNESD